MKKILLAAMLAGATLTITACADKVEPLPHQGESPEYIYAIGHQEMQQGQYYKAIRTFQSLNVQYPFQKWSELGNVDLIYVYVQDNKPEMALALAQQFIRAYPSSQYLGYVYYMMGVVNFDNGRGFLQKFLPYDMAQHDPSAYIEAIHNFQKAISLDPNGHFVPDAQRRIVYLNNVIGEYYLNIGQFYYNHEAYAAAVNRAKIVVEQYPQSTAVEPALVLMIQSYEAMNFPDLAQKSFEVLQHNYPNNAFVEARNKARNTAAVTL